MQYKRAVVCSEKRIARLMFLKRFEINKWVRSRNKESAWRIKASLINVTDDKIATRLTISFRLQPVL
jgi:DNA-binding transcriptional regulator YdaS (Cro superfamily)